MEVIATSPEDAHHAPGQAQTAANKALLVEDGYLLRPAVQAVLQELHPVGQLELRVPHDRVGRFSTEMFERCQRPEKVLVGAGRDVRVPGVSTLRVPPGCLNRCPACSAAPARAFCSGRGEAGAERGASSDLNESGEARRTG